MFNRILQSLKESLNKRRQKNFTELPPGIKTGLTKYLKPNEEVLLTLLNFRAIYKATTLIDSNTFFYSWFILTNRRIIVARNSSSFKKFRDIPHDSIDQIYYETGASEFRLIIHSLGTVDIIEFLRESRIYSEDLDIKVNRVIEEAKKAEKPGISDTIICLQCGSKIPRVSKFCSECGRGIKSLP